MSKKTLILLLTAAAFVACSTANSIPIDDAYYSPQVESPASATATPSSSSSQSSVSSASSFPSLSNKNERIHFVFRSAFTTFALQR